MCSLSLFLFSVGCDKTEQKETPVDPVVAEIVDTKVELQRYFLSATGSILNAAEGEALQYGMCYNESIYGLPDHKNEKTTFINKETTGTAGEMPMQFKVELMPEREYFVRLYVVNSTGTVYSATQKVQTPETNFEWMLAGKYNVSAHKSYFKPTVYDDYQVEVVVENNKYYLCGLGAAPLGAEARDVKMEMELTEQKDANGTYYRIHIPIQLTDLQADYKNEIYAVLMLGGSWLMDEQGQDIWGRLIIGEEHVSITLDNGYAFVMADPFSHEIKLNSDYPPVELILGPRTYPGYDIPSMHDKYPRPDCQLNKVMF